MCRQKDKRMNNEIESKLVAPNQATSHTVPQGDTSTANPVDGVVQIMVTEIVEWLPNSNLPTAKRLGVFNKCNRLRNGVGLNGNN